MKINKKCHNYIKLKKTKIFKKIKIYKTNKYLILLNIKNPNKFILI